MKVLVFGAGAIGSAVGGFLKKAGCDVWFLGRKPHVDVVNEQGLLITGIWGEHRISGIKAVSTTSALEGEEFDAVVLSVKSYDTDKAIEDLKKIPARIYVSFQNGLGNVEKLEDAFGKERAGGARVIFGSELTSPGRINITVEADAVAIGPLWEVHGKKQKNLLSQLALHLSEGGIKAFYTDNVIVYLWAKVLYNAPLNPLSALLRLPYGKLLESEHTRLLMREAVREGYSVARGELRDLIPWKSGDEYVKLFEEKLVPSTRAHFASMMHDLWNRGRTEVDAINGEIVRRGTMQGVHCPVNFTLLKLMHAFEEMVREGRNSH